MSQWKLRLAEAAPAAISIAFLLAIAAAPHISLPAPKHTLEAIVKEHFWRELSFQRNIPALLQRLSQTDLKKMTRQVYPVLQTVPSHASRGRVNTVINLDIDNLVETTDWQTQLYALRERRGMISVYYTMIKD